MARREAIPLEDLLGCRTSELQGDREAESAFATCTQCVEDILSSGWRLSLTKVGCATDRLKRVTSHHPSSLGKAPSGNMGHSRRRRLSLAGPYVGGRPCRRRVADVHTQIAIPEELLLILIDKNLLREGLWVPIKLQEFLHEARISRCLRTMQGREAMGVGHRQQVWIVCHQCQYFPEVPITTIIEKLLEFFRVTLELGPPNPTVHPVALPQARFAKDFEVWPPLAAPLAAALAAAPQLSP
mmetsp:Transcript_62209/g.140335  ORF Transcript_62209/g.140335 Transcript_62209/m.140335 type:complete len:241 (+) Transcript_62209:414-1136(+)